MRNSHAELGVAVYAGIHSLLWSNFGIVEVAVLGSCLGRGYSVFVYEVVAVVARGILHPMANCSAGPWGRTEAILGY